MILSYAHSRAAILCFGGWGMQVMYHLLPRLQAAQEQRAALSSNPADLSRLTSFGAVIADPLIDAQQRAQFYIRQPRLDQPLPPFYVERTLGRLERELPRSFDEQTAGVMTAAVPQANTSVISPAAAFFCHSSISTLRSSTANPASIASCSNESRVIPGSSEPDNSGVTSRADAPVPSTKKRFIPPISSTKRRSTASSHTTCSQPFSAACA